MLALPYVGIKLYRRWTIYGHIPTIDKNDHQVHRLSEFYPYAILKPKEINCDRDTWLKDPDEQTLYGNGPANWQPPFLCIIKQTKSGLQLIVFYRRCAITVIYRPDYRQE